jgi:hypothetical protein
MRGWSMWLMRMRLAMNSHRRKKVAEGGGGRPLGPGVALGGPAGAPAGISPGVGAWRLQPTRLRVWLCQPSPQSMADDKRHTKS